MKLNSKWFVKDKEEVWWVGINPFGQISMLINWRCLGGRILFEGLDNKHKLDEPILIDGDIYYGMKEILEPYFWIASSLDHNFLIQDSGLMIFSIIPYIGEDNSYGEP